MTLSSVPLDVATAARLIEQLTRRIEMLERALQSEREREPDLVAEELPALVNTLRQRSVVLLHLGVGRARELQEVVRSKPARVALEMAWDLDAAPLSDDLKASLRAAAGGGMNRW